MRAPGRGVSTLSLVVIAGAVACGGKSTTTSTSQKTVTLHRLETCLNARFHSDNVEREAEPANPTTVEALYAAARRQDLAVSLSGGGTAFVIVFPSASAAKAAAKASPIAEHLVVRDNTVTAFVHAPPPASAPPAKQRAQLALISPPAKDAGGIQAWACA